MFVHLHSIHQLLRQPYGHYRIKQHLYLKSIEFKKALPNVKGLNHQNLRYAEKFYTMYKKIFQQVVEQMLSVPWGHHRIMIDKCKTLEKCLFYIRTTIENNLSRYDLEGRILADVYERSQNILDNFSKTLSSLKQKK